MRFVDEYRDPESVEMPKTQPLAPEVRKAVQAAAEPYARLMAKLREAAGAPFE